MLNTCKSYLYATSTGKILMQVTKRNSKNKQLCAHHPPCTSGQSSYVYKYPKQVTLRFASALNFKHWCHTIAFCNSFPATIVSENLLRCHLQQWAIHFHHVSLPQERHTTIDECLLFLVFLLFWPILLYTFFIVQSPKSLQGLFLGVELMSCIHMFESVR